MPDFVNVIEQSAITTPSIWPSIIVAVPVLTTLVGTLVYMFISKNPNRHEKVTAIVGFAGTIGIVLLLISTLISSSFFHIPTGRYKYIVEFDESATIQECEDFLSKYNIIKYEGGRFYLEDKN